MKHQCKITVLETKVFTDYQEEYLANPISGPCPFFKKGDTFFLDRTPQKDDFYHLILMRLKTKIKGLGYERYKR